MADWATISSLATAGGTLVLAAATYASVRSARRSTRITERALLAGIRPLLVPPRLTDPPEKVGFGDGHWSRIEPMRAAIELTDTAIYLAFGVRNVGTGIAVLDQWDLSDVGEFDPTSRVVEPPRDADDFHRLTRDLYVAPGDNGFWQGALRDPSEPLFKTAAGWISARRRLAVDLLYGDYEGGQHTITRFGLLPHDDGGWFTVVIRHWNIDRDDPR